MNLIVILFCSLFTFNFNPLVSASDLIITNETAKQFINQSNSDYIDSWLQFEKFSHHWITNLASTIAKPIDFILIATNVSSQCSSSLTGYINDLKQFKTSALQRLDATGTRPVALMSGSFFSYGSYEQCVSMDTSQYCLLSMSLGVPKSRKYEGHFRKLDNHGINFTTQPFNEYVVNYLHFHHIVNYTYGLCLPRGCSSGEVERVTSLLADYHQTGLTIDVKHCDVKNVPPMIPIHVYVGAFIVITIIILNILGTITSVPFLTDFNVTTNYNKLIAGSADIDSGSSLTFLHGIKAISMFMIVVSHALLATVDVNTARMFQTITILPSLSFMPAYFFPLAVDTFFMVTGLSMSLFIQKRKRVTMFVVILGRYLRFLPSLVWAISWAYLLMNEVVKNELGGPNWFHPRATNLDKCVNNWLPNILLIQMWLDWKPEPSGSHGCLVTDWYLTVDLICTMFLTIVWIPISEGRRRQALFCTWLMIVFGILFSGFSLYIFDLRHFWRISDFLNEDSINYNFRFHLKPVAHLAPYFIGVLLGFYLNGTGKKLSQAKINFGWSLWTIGWIIHLFFFNYNDYDSKIFWWSSLVYGSISKSLWSGMVAWLIYTIREGHATPLIGRILSSQILLIASRMSLSILCLNIIFFRFRNGISTVPMETSVFKFLFLDQFPYFFLIYFVSFMSRILVESPFSNLVSKLFAPGKPRVNPQDPTIEVSTHRSITNEQSTESSATQRSEV